jgi:hypothetical protein
MNSKFFILGKTVIICFCLMSLYFMWAFMPSMFVVNIGWSLLILGVIIPFLILMKNDENI